MIWFIFIILGLAGLWSLIEGLILLGWGVIELVRQLLLGDR